MTKRTFFLSTLAIVLLGSLPVHAGLSGIFKKKPRRVETLIITGNFIKSRILAELVQDESKQPVLLLPTGNEDDVCYYLPPKGQSLEIEAKDFISFVEFLQPRKVLFLGNAQYASPDYHQALLQHNIVTWAVTNDDWEQIANSVGETMKIKNLYFDYLVLLNQIDAEGKVIGPYQETRFGEFLTGEGGEKWMPEVPPEEAAPEGTAPEGAAPEGAEPLQEGSSAEPSGQTFVRPLPAAFAPRVDKRKGKWLKARR
jgi:hypothetical protein